MSVIKIFPMRPKKAKKYICKPNPWKCGYADAALGRECKSQWKDKGWEFRGCHERYLAGYLAGQLANQRWQQAKN